MSEALERFRAEYDPTHDLKFAGVRYRDSAPFSNGPAGKRLGFGLVEGYRPYSAGLQWGWVRFHGGPDRARGPWWAPFAAEASSLETDQTTQRVYGSLVRLVVPYGFELRVAHMTPGEDFEPEALALLLRHAPVPRGMLMGEAGYNGISATTDPNKDNARHTHGEIVAKGNCELLDEILLAKYGEATGREYSDAEVEAIYRQYPRYATESREAILAAYAKERIDKGVEWANRYRATYGWDYYVKAPVTRYSSELLFGM